MLAVGKVYLKIQLVFYLFPTCLLSLIQKWNDFVIPTNSLHHSLIDRQHSGNGKTPPLKSPLLKTFF